MTGKEIIKNKDLFDFNNDNGYSFVADEFIFQYIRIMSNQTSRSEIVVSEEETVLFFCLIGNAACTSLTGNELINFSPHQANKFSWDKNSNPVLTVDSNSSEILIIRLKKSFSTFFNFDSRWIKAEEVEKILQSPIIHSSKNNQSLDYAIVSIIYNLEKTIPSENLRKPYFLAKAVELSIIIHQVFNGQNNKPKEELHPDALAQMMKVKEILTLRVSENLTLKELAHEVGTNEYTLKRNFKTVFGKTVFQYWTGLRMELAKQWFLESNMKVRDASEKLGYGHTTHFSAAFKKYFGFLPNSIRVGKSE
jgi:AraC-like DNA-binding protein